MGRSRFETLRPETLLREHVALRTNEVDDFHAYIAGMAGRIERDYRADASIDLELRHVSMGMVDVVAYFGNIDITAETIRPLPSPYLVQFPLRGHFVARYPDRVLEIHPGRGLVISPTQHVRRTSKPGCKLVVSVNSPMLYVDSHLDEEFKVARLAEIAGCNVRTMQSDFAGLCRTSVLSFSKQRRLNAARQRLESGKQVESISTIALECGLTQFGRFSIDYRNYFGETPSETLARSKRKRFQGDSDSVQEA